MNKPAIISALKEHNPKISEMHSDDDLLNFLTGVEVAGDFVIQAIQNAVSVIDSMCKVNPEFKSLVEASVKVNEVMK